MFSEVIAALRHIGRRLHARLSPRRALAAFGVALVAAILIVTSATVWYIQATPPVALARQALLFGFAGSAGAIVVGLLLIGVYRLFVRQEQLTAALQVSEQRLREVTEASSDWIWETDEAMRLTYVSDRLYETTGMRPGDVLGRTREELSGDYIDSEHWRRNRDDIRHRRAFRGFEYSPRRKDGVLLRVRISGAPVFNRNGVFTGYRGAATNVTAEHDAEQRAELAQQRLQDAVDMLAEGFVLYDQFDRLVMCNSRYRELHTQTPEAVQLGASFEDIFRASLRSGESLTTEDEDVFVARRLQRHRDPSAPFELLAGERILLVAERRTSDGGVVGLHTDITEIKRREAMLIEAKQSADTASRTKSEFLANMSHELRTPLNAIIGFAEIVERQVFGADSPRYFGYAHDIRTSGEHLLAVINDILDMSKIESGRYEFTEHEVAVTDVLVSCYAMIKGRAQDRSVTVTVPEGLPDVTLRADRRALVQVLLNLLSNAVKFTHTGGSVTIAVERAFAGVTIVVEDNGAGIAPEVLPRVFEPFRRGPAEVSRREEGTGLGLAISRRLVEGMGGTLELRSRVGRGTQARVAFPTASVVSVNEPPQQLRA